MAASESVEYIWRWNRVPQYFWNDCNVDVHAEIVRAGIQSVNRGQTEAARSLDMSNAQAMRKVILPQAFRRIMPPLAGQFISLIKGFSLLGVIAIRELTKATRESVTSSLRPFEMWIVCAVLYLLLTFTLSVFIQYLERRTVIR